MKRLILTLALCFLVLLLPATTVIAASITLSWQPPFENEDGTTCNDLAGYKIYYGVQPSPQNFDYSIDVGNVNTYQLNGLTSGLTYYFATTAYDTSGNESVFSNIKMKQIIKAGTLPANNFIPWFVPMMEYLLD